MKEYFTGHKDSVVINEFLNFIPEDSADFKVVYRLRKMGEEFVEGSLSMDEVMTFSNCLPASSKTEAFIHKMKCYTFYSVLCDITSGKGLSPFGKKVKSEVEHPSFCRPLPKGKVAIIQYKLERIWKIRWKHPLVFNEYCLPATVTWIWSVVRMQKVVKD